MSMLGADSHYFCNDSGYFLFINVQNVPVTNVYIQLGTSPQRTMM